MKRFKLINALAIAAFGLFALSSCDPCASTECNNGTCVLGDCECDAGYSGTDCSTEDRAQFEGTYLVSGTIACPVTGDGTVTNEAMTITPSATSVTKFNLNISGGVLVLTCTVDGTGFTVDNTVTNGLEYSGSGSINGNTVSITINEVEPNVETCVYTLTATKQ